METKNKKNGNIPNLRFKGFEGEWEKLLLNEIAKKNNRKNRENKVSVVFSNSASQGIVLQSEYFDKDIANKENLDGYYVVAPNDFVYNPRLSSNAEVGAMNVNHTSQIGLVSPLYTVFRIINISINNLFVEFLLKSKVWHSYMRSIANFGARDDRMNIKNDDLFGLPLYVPKNAEQTKIASFLSLIDEQIDTQMKTIEEWEKMMKGLRNKIFSELNGEVVLLGEIANIYQPKTIDSSQLIQNGEYLVFGANGIIGKYHSFNHKLPQICITCRGASCGNINFTATESYITGNAMVINIDDKFETINKRFLYYQLLTYNFTNIITGSGQPQIVRSPLIKIKIRLPHIEIQNQIVSILDKIEEKLTLEKSILSSYQQQKKYLLQNLFI